MMITRRRILAAIGAVGALVAAAVLMLPAQATQPTPAPEVSTSILARSLFDPIHVTAMSRPAPPHWTVGRLSSRPTGNPTSMPWTTRSRRERAAAGIRIRGPV
jgi:hypothetical protein